MVAVLDRIERPFESHLQPPQVGHPPAQHEYREGDSDRRREQRQRREDRGSERRADDGSARDRRCALGGGAGMGGGLGLSCEDARAGFDDRILRQSVG